MLRMKKGLAVIAAAASLLSVAACGGTSSSSGSSSKELLVWVAGDSQTKFEKLVEPFEKETGVSVRAVAIPWDSMQQKITTAVASGDGPDILQIGLSNLKGVADTGKLMKLDDSTVADYPNLKSSNFMDAVAGDATSISGKGIVSIPYIADTRVLFYRSDILKESGIENAPTTWSELRTDAKTLAQRGKGKYGFFIPQWDSALPVIMTWDQGGDIVNKSGNIDFNTDAFSKATDLYSSFYKDKSVPTSADFDQVQGFTSGATPMVVSGPYLATAINEAAPDLKGKWSVAQIPSAQNGTSLFAGSNLGVWNSTSKKKQALQLLNYLSDPEVQAKWYKNGDGSLPTVKKAYDSDLLKNDELVQAYSKQLEDSKLLPFDPNWDSKTSQSLLKALNSIVLNGTDKQTALNSLYSETKNASIN